jgi:ribosomal protein S18 acetylase RimI-like enzyme
VSIGAIHICAARSEELPAVEGLFQQVVGESSYYNEWAKRSELVRYTAEKLAQMGSTEPESVLVARAGDDLAGFCFSHNDGMGLIWLGWVGVAEGYRRRGVAEALVRRLIDGAAPRGGHKVWCDTRIGNKPSEAFFKKLGFVVVCELRNHWYGLDYYLWEKEG